jgi:Leucine-rich repeat (LRR) protein
MISELAVLRVLELSDNRVEEISDLLHLKYLERLYLSIVSNI